MLHKKQKNLHQNRPPPRPLSHGERGACFTKTKKPPPKPTSPPAPLPWGEGSMLHKKQKKLKTYKAKMVSAEMAQSPEIILTAIV